MNPRVTLILIILLIALGGYIYFFEIKANDDQANPDSDLIQIYDAVYGEYDVVGLEIVGAQGKAHFSRTDETLTQDWQMLEPEPIPPDQLDQVWVNGAATRLAGLTASQVITGVTDLAQYGLEKPELTVTLTISDGQKITLYTGAETPVNNNRYIRTTADDRSVYLVFSFAVDDLFRLLTEPPLAPTPLPILIPTASP